MILTIILGCAENLYKTALTASRPYQGVSQFMHGNCNDLVIIFFRFQSQWTEVDIPGYWSEEAMNVTCHHNSIGISYVS